MNKMKSKRKRGEGSERTKERIRGKEKYRIERDEGELIVSEKHKVYAYTFNFSLSSLVEKTPISDCTLKAGSLDQIEEFIDNANANIRTSLSCGDKDFAFFLNFLFNSSGIILRTPFSSSNINITSSKDILEYLEIEGYILNNSFQQCSGEYSSKSNCLEFKIINLTGLSLKNEIKTLVSTTSFMNDYQPSFFNFSQAFWLTSLPSLKASSSVNSEFSSILSSFLSKKSLLTFSTKNCLVASDTLNSGNWSICFFKSSEMDNVMFGILIHLVFYSVYPVKDVQVYKPFDLQSILNVNMDQAKEIIGRF